MRFIDASFPLFIHLTATTNSNADAPTFSSEHQATVIAKPHEETQQFGDFFAYITQQETDPEFPLDSEVRYAQTREIQTLPPPPTTYVSIF